MAISAVVGFEAPFELVEPLPPFVVAPGERVTVLVQFSPGQTGEVRRRIHIYSNDSNEPTVRVTLRGSGTSGRRK
jgi:hypothetical protein